MSIEIMSVKATVSKTIQVLLPIVVFFFDPNQAKLMVALLALMTFDTFAGAYYAYNKGTHTNKIFWTKAVSKFLIYFSAIACSRILEYFLFGIPYSQELDTYLLAFFALTEAKSFYTYLVKFGIKIPILPKLEKIASDILDANK